VIDYFIKKREESERIASIVPRGSRVSRGKTRKFLKLRKMKGGVRASGQTGPWDGSVVANIPGSLLHHMRIILALDDTAANNALFEDFIFRAYNHLIHICETPLDYRLIYIYLNIDRIENSTLDAFYTEYMGYHTNPEVLQFASSVRDMLGSTAAAARAYDPMEMLEPLELQVLDKEVNNQHRANLPNAVLNLPTPVNVPNALLNVPTPVNIPNAVLNLPTPVNVPNAVLNNAYATNAENLPNPPRYQPIFQNIRKGKTEKKKTLIKSTPYYKPGSTPQKRPAYGYFQSMTGLTPRGIHVARKTRKRKNSTFKK
jgi:hypothetical protein